MDVSMKLELGPEVVFDPVVDAFPRLPRGVIDCDDVLVVSRQC